MQRWEGFHSGVPRTILQEATIPCLGALTVTQQPHFTGSGPRGCVFRALSGPLPSGGQCAHPELVCELELSYMGCKGLQWLPHPASHTPELSESVTVLRLSLTHPLCLPLRQTRVSKTCRQIASDGRYTNYSSTKLLQEKQVYAEKSHFHPFWQK